MRTRVCKKLSWLIPYINEGKKFISKEHKIARVGAWSLGKSRGKSEAAAIFQTRLGEPHRIWLHTHHSKDAPYSKIDILTHLAHELAHTEDWKHTPRHADLEAKIKRRFMKMLEKEGYVSEEKELS